MGEIGVNKLFFHNEKVKNILNTIKLNYEKPDTSYPVSVELSLTNRCNLKCVWCVDWHLRKLDKSEIEFDILKKLILDLERGGTKGITIEGGGEPTCYSHFKELMKIIENVNIKFGLITNGVMIPYIDHIEKFEWIRVSIDVDSEDNYHKYKKGNRKDYNNLFKNLHKLVIASKKRTVIGASYIATKYNMDNIISVIKKVRDIGVDYFYIRPVEDCELLLPSEDCFKGLEKYSTDKFRMLVNYSDRLICGNLGLPCVSHSLSSVITSASKVYLCGRLHIHPEWQPIGDLQENTFDEIWNSSNRKKQSMIVINKDFTYKYCPVCRMTKYNELICSLKDIRTTNFL